MVDWKWETKRCAWLGCGAEFQPTGSRQEFCRPACKAEQLDLEATAGMPAFGDGRGRTSELAPQRCDTCSVRLQDRDEHIVCPNGCLERERDEIASA